MNSEYIIGQEVRLIIGRKSDLGYNVLINSNDEGLLFFNEVFQPLEEDIEIIGFIKKIREDGKIDVSIRPIGFNNVIDKDCDTILSLLKKTNSINLNDKSDPEDILSQFKMSKKAFKRAIGVLYKKKKIVGCKVKNFTRRILLI